MSKCLDIPIIYFLQKELTNFGLAVLGQSELKIKQEKLIKIFGLYLVFIHNFFCIKMTKYYYKKDPPISDWRYSDILSPKKL